MTQGRDGDSRPADDAGDPDKPRAPESVADRLRAFMREGKGTGTVPVATNVGRTAEDGSERDGRAILEQIDPARDENEVRRLDERARDQSEVLDSRRRVESFAHFKAAVAATQAERTLGNENDSTGQAEGPDAIDRYRDDLYRAVQPLPQGAVPSGSRRPESAPYAPPLLLDEGQRVDPEPAPPRPAPAAVPEPPARPAPPRAKTPPPASEDDAPPTVPETAFADYARAQSATSMAELMAAAAVYMTEHERRSHFSRPQIMRKVALVAGEEAVGREEGLRAFGTLLRDGRIRKLRRGMFTLSQPSGPSLG